MKLFIYHALAIALGSNLDVFEMIDGVRMNESKETKSETLKCGECSGSSIEMSDKFSGKKLYWRKCKTCNMVSKAGPKKKSLHSWNELSRMVAELKERKWTA